MPALAHLFRHHRQNTAVVFLKIGRRLLEIDQVRYRNTMLARGSRAPTRSSGSGCLAHAAEPIANDTVGVRHDPVDEFPTAWDVVDETGDHATRPHTGVHIAVLHDLRINTTRNLVKDVFEFDRIAKPLFLFEQTLSRRVR